MQLNLYDYLPIWIFDYLPIWSFYISMPLVLLLSFEAGYQISKYVAPRNDKLGFDSISPMVTGLLAMLAFVLALTFSMASTQHNLREQNVLNDTKIIGTAYLRADLLGEQDKTKVRQLLKEYVDNRVNAIEAATTEQMKTMMERSVEIHHLLWNQVTSAMKRDPNSDLRLLLQSINDLIDSHQERIASGLYNRIPSSIWLVLLAISVLTMMTMGSQAKLTQSRRLSAVIPLILAFTALTTIILDLDRPKEGMIILGQQVTIDLQKSLKLESK